MKQEEEDEEEGKTCNVSLGSFEVASQKLVEWKRERERAGIPRSSAGCVYHRYNSSPASSPPKTHPSLMAIAREEKVGKWVPRRWARDTRGHTALFLDFRRWLSALSSCSLPLFFFFWKSSSFFSPPAAFFLAGQLALDQSVLRLGRRCLLVTHTLSKREGFERKKKGDVRERETNEWYHREWVCVCVVSVCQLSSVSVCISVRALVTLSRDPRYYW